MRAGISISPSADTANLALWAKAIAMGEGQVHAAKEFAERQRMPDRVKAAIAPILTTDGDADSMANSRSILTSFTPLLRNSSAFFRAFDSGMIRLPMQTRISFMTSAAQMGYVGEAQLISVRRAAFDDVTLTPRKAAGIIVFSQEMLAFLSAGGEAFLSNELKRAVSAAVDSAFLDLIDDGSTPTAASLGSTETAAMGDVYRLFESVGLTAESRPLLVLAPDVARRASTLVGGGGRAFPNLGPTGGTMCNVEAIVSDGIAAGSMGLLDCAGVAGDVSGIDIKNARHASLQLDDAGDSPETASSKLISLWQRNLVGICPTVYFAAQRLRSTAWATVTGIQYNGSGNSP